MIRSKRGSVDDPTGFDNVLRSGGSSDWLTAAGTATGAAGFGVAACFSVSSMRFCAERSLAGYGVLQALSSAAIPRTTDDFIDALHSKFVLPWRRPCA